MTDSTSLTPEEAHRLARDYVIRGSELDYHEAVVAEGPEADWLFEQAYDNYQAALEIEPGMYVALTQWGTTLMHHGHQKSGDEARHLFELACEKLEAALRIKSDYTLAQTILDQVRERMDHLA